MLARWWIRKSWTLPPQQIHKFSNNLWTNSLCEKLRNYLDGKDESRLTEAGRDIWDTFSPESLPPAQHHMIEKGPPSWRLLLVEGGGWFTCPDHVFWLLASVLPGLELCGVCLGENGDWWVGLVNTIDLSSFWAKNKKTKYSSSQYSPWEENNLFCAFCAPVPPGAAQRNGTWLASLGIA